MESTPSLPLFQGPLWLGVAVFDMFPSMGQIELFEHLTVGKQMTDVKLNSLCYRAILGKIYLCKQKCNVDCLLFNGI